MNRKKSSCFTLFVPKRCSLHTTSDLLAKFKKKGFRCEHRNTGYLIELDYYPLLPLRLQPENGQHRAMPQNLIWISLHDLKAIKMIFRNFQSFQIRENSMNVQKNFELAQWLLSDYVFLWIYSKKVTLITGDTRNNHSQHHTTNWDKIKVYESWTGYCWCTYSGRFVPHRYWKPHLAQQNQF